VDVLPFGSVGVILGLKHTRTGDTLVSSSWGSSASHSPGTQASAKSSSPLRDITPPPAVISASVLPQSHADLEPVQEALQALSRTDPSVRITEEDEGQTLVHGLGALHLEIVEGRLRDEWGVRCTFGKRHVSYRESFGGTGSIRVEKRWEKDVGEKKLGARVSLDVRLIEEGEAVDEVWGGNIVVDSTGARLPPPDIDTLSDPSISSIASGLSARLSSSPFTTLPISNAHITLRSFSLDPSAPPSLLTVSSSVALGDALEQAGGGNVMEPHVRVKVDVAEESVGKCVRDLTENGGQILDLGSSSSSTGTALDEELTPYSETDLYIPPAWLSPSAVTSPKGLGGPQIKRSIHAVAPLSKMLDYSSRLRAVSGGLGTFEMSNEGFREVSEARRMEILREIGRA
jgi:elongation factor G